MSAATITNFNNQLDVSISSPTTASPNPHILNFSNPDNRYLELECLYKIASEPTYTSLETKQIGQVTSYDASSFWNDATNIDTFMQYLQGTSGASMIWRLKSYTDSGYTTQDGSDQDRTTSVGVPNGGSSWAGPTFTTAELENVDQNIEVRDKYNNLLVTSSTETLIGSSDPIAIRGGYSKMKFVVSVANKATPNYYAEGIEYYSGYFPIYSNDEFFGETDAVAGTGTINENPGYDVESDPVDFIFTDSSSPSISARDSRLISSGSISVPFDLVIDYQKVNIFNVKGTRDNSVEAPTKLSFSGTMFDAYFGSGDSTPTGTENDLTVEYRYKESAQAWGAQSWSDVTGSVSVTDGDISFDAYINGDLGSGGFDTEKSFNIEVRVHDKLSQQIVEITLPVGTPVMDIRKAGVAIKGVFDTAINAVLQVFGNLFVDGNVDSDNIRDNWNLLNLSATYADSFGFFITGDHLDRFYRGMDILIEQDYDPPVGYWTFDSSNRLDDSSASNNDLTAIGDPTYATEKFDNAILDSNDAYSLPNNTSELLLYDAITVSMWFKSSNSGATSKGLYQAWSNNGNRAGILMYVNSSNIFTFEVANFGNSLGTNYQVALADRDDIMDGKWHHLVGSWDGTKIRVYIDGKLEGVNNWSAGVTYAIPAIGTTYCRLGCISATGSNSNFIDGEISDVAVFDYALTTSAIRNLYKRNQPVGLDTALFQDFSVHEEPQLDGSGTYIELGGDGEVKNGTVKNIWFRHNHQYEKEVEVEDSVANATAVPVSDTTVYEFNDIKKGHYYVRGTFGMVGSTTLRYLRVKVKKKNSAGSVISTEYETLGHVHSGVPFYITMPIDTPVFEISNNEYVSITMDAVATGADTRNDVHTCTVKLIRVK